MIKKIICFICIFIALTINVSAEETDFYKDQLEQSGALDLEENLPPEVERYLKESEIDITDYNWVSGLRTENVFSHIWEFLKGGFKTPLIALLSVVAIIIINSILFTEKDNSVTLACNYAATLSVIGILIAPIIAAINTAVNAMRACATFMTAFIPVFAAVCAASGKTATAASMGAMLLGAANGVSLLSNFAVVPLIGGYLSLSLATSVSPFLNNNGISSAVKKLSLWVMSLISTVFLGVLSIQTVVNSAADNLSMRTAKFIIGSAVPVAGGVLSEALGTLTASISLLKSSVGIYGVVVCCLIFLPILIQLLLWRFSLWVGGFVSQTFSASKISGLLEALDTVLSVLIGVILLTAAMFIISLSVVMGQSK